MRDLIGGVVVGIITGWLEDIGFDAKLTARIRFFMDTVAQLNVIYDNKQVRWDIIRYFLVEIKEKKNWW